MRNRPLAFVTVAYICGIILSRYYFIQGRALIIILAFLSAGIFIPLLFNAIGFSSDKSLEKACFYIALSIIGYLMYQAVSSGNSFPHFPLFDILRQHISRSVYYNVPKGEEKELLGGLLLGQRYMVSEKLLNIFRCTNTVHILAISGLHVGFIGFILIGVLRLLFVPRKITGILTILGVILYVSIVGWRPPAFRAGIIFCVFFIGLILDKAIDLINSLFFAALVILLIMPQTLFKPGFQLSFIIVFSLMLMAPVIAGFKGYILQALGVSTVAWLSSLPIIAYYFGIISPISILANIIVVPVIGLVIALGFTSVFLGQAYLPLSGVFNCANYYLLKGMIWFVRLLAHIPYGYFYIRKFSVYIVFVSYIILGLIFFLLKRRQVMIE